MGVDAVPPESPLRWRRALTVRKAPAEKICLQRLVCQRPFQSADFLAERRLTGIRAVAPRHLSPVRVDRARYTTAADGRLTPIDKFHNVVALFQSCDRILSKRLRKLAHALLGHLPPSWCKCANVGCLNLGVQSIRLVPARSALYRTVPNVFDYFFCVESRLSSGNGVLLNQFFDARSHLRRKHMSFRIIAILRFAASQT